MKKKEGAEGYENYLGRDSVGADFQSARRLTNHIRGARFNKCINNIYTIKVIDITIAYYYYFVLFFKVY